MAQQIYTNKVHLIIKVVSLRNLTKYMSLDFAVKQLCEHFNSSVKKLLHRLDTITPRFMAQYRKKLDRVSAKVH